MAQRDNFIEQIYYVNFRQSFPFNFLWEAALDNIVINYNKSGMLHSQKKNVTNHDRIQLKIQAWDVNSDIYTTATLWL